MNYLRLIIGINILIMLFSCDDHLITNEFVIDNQSHSDLTIYFDSITFHSIKHGEKKTVFKKTDTDLGDYPFLSDSVWITSSYKRLVYYITDSVHDKKNIWFVSKDWKCEGHHNNGDEYNKYTFTLTDEDFVTETE